MLAPGRGFAQGAPQTGKLIVNTYGGIWERYWRSTLVPGFTKQTGIAPVIDIGVGKIFAANLRAAGIDKTPYSLVLMNENIAAQLREEGFFDPIPADKVPELANVLPQFRVKEDKRRGGAGDADRAGVPDGSGEDAAEVLARSLGQSGVQGQDRAVPDWGGRGAVVHLCWRRSCSEGRRTSGRWR